MKMYRGMVKVKDSKEPAKPMEGSGVVYYTDDLHKLSEMLRHMSLRFIKNEYSIEEVDMI